MVEHEVELIFGGEHSETLSTRRITTIKEDCLLVGEVEQEVAWAAWNDGFTFFIGRLRCAVGTANACLATILRVDCFDYHDVGCVMYNLDNLRADGSVLLLSYAQQ